MATRNIDTNPFTPDTRPTSSIRIRELVCSSLASGTRKSYRRFLDTFKDFCLSQQPKLKSSPARDTTVAVFIAHLHDKGFAASTICSHLSAISFHHRLVGEVDPCQSFVVQRMILGCKKGCKSSDCRLPILKPMLHQLVDTCTRLKGLYNQVLYQSILLLAYHGFFRIGEILPSQHACVAKVVQRDHIAISESSVILKLFNYKTRRSQKPLLITVKATNSRFCPVRKLKSYLSMRGNKIGPLFLHWNGKPVLKSHFNFTFKSLLSWGDFPTSVYKPHSLQIGACSQAILSGVPQEVVMEMGRWQSYSAFKRYVRLQM